MLTEEEVLAQIAWDICRGFLNIKADTTTRISCKMWEHHLQTLVLGSGDIYCKQAFISSTAAPASHSQSELLSNVPILCRIDSFLNTGAFQSPALHRALAYGGLKGTVGDLG